MTFVDTTRGDQLRAPLDRGRNHRDTDDSAIDDLGYRVALWNGRDGDESASFNVGIGATSLVPGAGTNSVVLTRPTRLGSEPEAHVEILQALLSIWSPEEMAVTSPEYRRGQRRIDGRAVFGWFTYLPTRRVARLGGVPAGVEQRELGDGVLLITGEHPDRGSVERAAELAERYQA